MPRRASPPRLYLRQRENGARVWIILDRGRQVSTGAGEDDRAAAHAALADYLGRTRRPDFGQGDPAAVIIADALAAYADEHARTHTRPEHAGFALRRLTAFFQERTVASLNETACKAYVAWRCRQTDARATRSKGRAITATTARRELAVLSAALHWCHRNGKLDRVVAITLPRARRARERHLTRGEAARLLAAALGFAQREDGTWRRRRDRINRHLARFILIGLYTGTRHSAILQLQWTRNTSGGHIDLDAGIIHRRAEHSVETDKRRPPLPIPPRLLPHLKRWQRRAAEQSEEPARQRRKRAANGSGAADNQKRGRFLIEWNGAAIAQLRTAWRKSRAAAGLERDVTPHVLRHTCATWLLQAGVSVYDVAGVLGCSEAVVRDTYGHHAHDNLRQAVAAFSPKR